MADISFCETDTETVEQAVITTYQGLTGTTLYPGDPVRLFLEALAAVIAQQRVLIDQAGKSNLVKYAAGGYLDAIGEMTDTTRLEATVAIVTVEFTLSAALASAVNIPAGTQVSPDGQLFFETTEAVEIPAGELSVSVSCDCMSAGTVGNGFLPGQITKLVDQFPYVLSVTNTTTSSGGSDEESDEAYAERIILAPEKYSVAGPGGAYEYWAKTAHQDIIDIAVYSPEAGSVTVIPLAVGGTSPSAEIISAVESLLNERDKRPLTDAVTVQVPEIVSYDLTLTYYISTDDMSLVDTIQGDVNTAIEEYQAWQRKKLGRDINPSELTMRVMAAGAKRVNITSPVFTALDVDQVANEATVSITYGGLEDE